MKNRGVVVGFGYLASTAGSDAHSVHLKTGMLE